MNDIDQVLAQMRDFIPRVYWSIYAGCLQVGFNEHQAMVCLTTYILSQCPHGIRPTDSSGPKKDEDIKGYFQE